MNDTCFRVRRADESDLDGVYGLMPDLGYPAINRNEFAATFSKVLEAPDMMVFVAEETDGRIIGLLSISHRPQLRLAGPLVTIDELVVKGRARGSGVGGALLEKARVIAAELGARRLELETNRTRESYRRRFYVKNGFIEADSAVMRLDT